jgi:hypothetical protein
MTSRWSGGRCGVEAEGDFRPSNPSSPERNNGGFSCRYSVHTNPIDRDEPAFAGTIRNGGAGADGSGIRDQYNSNARFERNGTSVAAEHYWQLLLAPTGSLVKPILEPISAQFIAAKVIKQACHYAWQARSSERKGLAILEAQSGL